MAPEHDSARTPAFYDHESDEPVGGRRAAADWGVNEDIFDRMPSRRFTRPERRAEHRADAPGPHRRVSGPSGGARAEPLNDAPAPAARRVELWDAEDERATAWGEAERAPKREVESWIVDEPASGEGRRVESWLEPEQRPVSRTIVIETGGGVRDDTDAPDGWTPDPRGGEKLGSRASDWGDPGPRGGEAPGSRAGYGWGPGPRGGEAPGSRAGDGWGPGPRGGEAPGSLHDDGPEGDTDPGLPAPRTIVLETGETDALVVRPAGAAPRAVDDEVSISGRRTVRISGHPERLPVPRARRPPRSAIDRIGTSPDRIVAYAVALGFLLVLIAVLTTGH